LTELSKLQWSIATAVSDKPSAYITDEITGNATAFILDHKDGTYTIQQFQPYTEGKIVVGIDELTAECFVIALRNPER
jgi:hypothetical protein